MSTFLYASETWTLNKDMEKIIEAMEIWFCRRMLKISYKDRTTNKEVFTRIEENKTLFRKGHCNILDTSLEQKVYSLTS
jgi:hypothetical protein